MSDKLSDNQLDEFLRIVNEKTQLNPTWRKGQTLFNVLSKLHPKLAECIRGTNNDPFYNDENIDNFYKYIINI